MKNFSNFMLIEKYQLSESFDEFKEKHGIKVISSGLGYSEKEQKWYGWSHRAVHGFGIGDMIFDKEYGNDETPYNKHGNEKIKNMKDAKLAAKRFSDYVS